MTLQVLVLKSLIKHNTQLSLIPSRRESICIINAVQQKEKSPVLSRRKLTTLGCRPVIRITEDLTSPREIKTLLCRAQSGGTGPQSSNKLLIIN